MRHFVTLVVVFMVCTACKAVEPQKIAVSELMMKFSTKIEQIHAFFGAGDFVINKEPSDCEVMRMAHSVSVQGDKLTIDRGTEDEITFNIYSCSYSKGKVFADRGTMEVYRLSCNELDDGTPSSWTSIITIQEIKDGTRTKTIIAIPRYDSFGVMYQNMVFQN